MDDEERGPRLSKRFSDKTADGEVDYKTKSGTAWSHSYLNQKPWHPLSYPNQRRKWIAEQTHAQRERRAEEVAREVDYSSFASIESLYFVYLKMCSLFWFVYAVCSGTGVFQTGGTCVEEGEGKSEVL